jgi:two-component sensor histidine kinase
VDLDDPKGFGFTLIRLLSDQLEGRVEVSREGGTEFRIFVPGTYKTGS